MHYVSICKIHYGINVKLKKDRIKCLNRLASKPKKFEVFNPFFKILIIPTSLLFIPNLAI